jgi:hypothetical protein
MASVMQPPDASGQTKPNNQGTSTAVPVTPKRKVTYVFKITSGTNVNLPYAVAVDGSALAAYANKPARVSGSSGKVVTFVDQGQKVSLFLNSDAHPSYRSAPVYEVTAGEHDIVVTITEKSGKHTDSDKPVLVPAKAGATVKEEKYCAPLTGDIWMKISHKYQANEVDGLVPPGTSDTVKAAVKSIYSGLKAASLTVSEPATDKLAARTLTVEFADSNNPQNNISSYTLMADGVTRVHPGGYAALFTAGLEANAITLNLTSCWRPMLGSIAHRAGLGLDVNYVGTTRMNRQELRNAFGGKKPSKKGNKNDKDNVTDDEVTKFGEYENAIVANKQAKANFAATNAALAKATKSGDAAAIVVAQTKYDAAKEALEPAASAETEARSAWNTARDEGEPLTVKQFRVSLLKCACVAQLFDPWVMDIDGQGGEEANPNMQRGAATSNERLHAHHLHITVREPRIL